MVMVRSHFGTYCKNSVNKHRIPKTGSTHDENGDLEDTSLSRFSLGDREISIAIFLAFMKSLQSIITVLGSPRYSWLDEAKWGDR